MLFISDIDLAAAEACNRLDQHGTPDCGGRLSARAEDSAVDMLVFLYKLRRDAERTA